MLDSFLGKKTKYSNKYSPGLILPIPRDAKRKEINIAKNNLPFTGVDIWNIYEVSWLNSKGKPMVGIVEIHIPAESENIIESKSLKLYFNSLNATKFQDLSEVISVVKSDIEKNIGIEIEIKFIDLENCQNIQIGKLQGYNIDHLDVEICEYQTNPDLLKIENEIQIEEKLNSNLLKSNCLVTNQPDWASIEIHYKGFKICHTSLLEYIISFRDHNEFHEQCVERIFTDIMNKCKPSELSIYARFTRRGGIDINPFRTNRQNQTPANIRLIRQ